MVRPLITVILFSAAAFAQIRGVPPSVTSHVTGPDGRALPRGVPPSVMSLGPEGFGSAISPSKSFHGFPRGGVIPVFFPTFYAVPYVLVERERVIEREVPVEMEPEEIRPRRRARSQEGLPTREEMEAEEPVFAAAPKAEPEPVNESTTPTLLVFRDGSRSEVRNFAIVGESLLVFAPDPVRKVLLAELDLEATRIANEARGLAFVLPD